jgi:hypothetical protein
MPLPKWVRRLFRLHPKAPGPRYVEIWGQIEANNRFLRRFAGVAIVLALVGLSVGVYGVHTALTRPVAFAVGPQGDAQFVGPIGQLEAPSEVEARYVARQFLQHYIAFNSLTVESDLAEAWNLMTDELQAQQRATLDDFEKKNGHDFVSYVKSQGMQTVLEFNTRRTQVQNHNDKAFTLHVRGKARTWPLNRLGQDAAFTERDFEAFVTLVRCSRTEQTPNGLLVAKVTNRFFVDESNESQPLAGTSEPASAP